MELTPNPIRLAIAAHPMSGDADLRLVAAGRTLLQTLQDEGVEGDGWLVTVDGALVPQAMWGRTRVRPGRLIEAQSLVRKQVMQLAAIVALSYFTFGAGGLAAGAAAGGAAGTTAGVFAAGGLIGGGFWAAAAVYVSGSLLINSLLGPKASNASSGSSEAAAATYALTGVQNRARLYESLCLVLGETKMVPDLASQQYPEFRGEDQYISGLFHGGINCGSVSDIRIASTSVNQYSEVRVKTAGFPLMPQDAMPSGSVDTITGGLVSAPADGTSPVVTRTSSGDTVMLGIDIETTLFEIDTSSGNPSFARLTFVAQYSVDGVDNWKPFTDDSASGEISIVNATSRPYRATYLREVPAGRYDVRMWKVSRDSAKSTLSNTLTWSYLKSYQVDRADYAGQARVLLDIKASGQLSGQLDSVSWIARSAPMPLWNGSAWVTVNEPGSGGISNPGALALLLMRGIYRGSDGRRIAGLGFADKRLHLDSWKAFMVRCAQMDFRFDAVIQQGMASGDLIDTILDAGWGQLARIDGKYGVVWLAEDQPIEGVVNMADIKARSFSIDYNLTPGADELSYDLVDRDGDWTAQSVRVMAPTTTGTPQSTASLTVLGITRQAFAAQRARLTMAQNVYGRKAISFEIDLQHLDWKRFDVLALSHDLTQYGYGGRLRALSRSPESFTVTVDEPVPSEAAAVRMLGLNLPGERQMRIWPVTAVSPDGRSITAAGDLPALTQGTGAEDVRWMFDFKATPGQRVRIAAITPSRGMNSAKIAVVPEDVEFWPYVLNGAWTPPPNNSRLKRAPVVTRAFVTEALQRQGTSYFTELTVSFDVTGNFARGEVWGGVDGGPVVRLGATTINSFGFRAGLDEVWQLEVRPFSDVAAGVRLVLEPYAVIGLRAPPPSIATVSSNGKVLSWPNISRAEVPDLAGYRVRFNYGANDDWGVATPMHEGLLTDSPYPLQVLPPGPVTIMVKAEDTSGNESIKAAVLYANLGDPEIANVVEQRDYRALGWPGALTGAHRSGGDLLADNTSPFYSDAAARFYNPNPNAPFYTEKFAAMQWESDRWFVPGTFIDAALMLAVDVDGPDYHIDFRRPGSAPFYGDPTAPMFGAVGDSMFAPDEPWQVWPGRLDAGAGFYQFRVSIGAGSPQGMVREFVATVDVPDREVTGLLQSIGPGGTRLTGVAGLFTSIKTVRGVLQGTSNATGFQILDYDPLLGPLIQTTPAGSTGVLNYDTKGY